jgi:hypothetical protein
MSACCGWPSSGFNGRPVIDPALAFCDRPEAAMVRALLQQMIYQDPVVYD